MSLTPYAPYSGVKSTTAFSAFPSSTSLAASYSMPGSALQPKPVDPVDDKTQKRISSALTAVALVGLGLMLNRIPAKPSAFEMVSTNLEDWVKMGLGVAAVGKVNEAADWKPKPWQHGLETVSLLTFMTQGLRLKGWKHFPLLALNVPVLVQGTHWLSRKTEDYLDRHNSTLPRWIPKLGITLASTLGGVYGLRSVMEAPWYRSTMGQFGATAGQQTLGAETLVCSRCGGTHLVCMEEVSDFIGSMVGWFKEHLHIGKQKS
jgi:hypothetical protein